MVKYLNSKPGSVEEAISNMTKSVRQDSAYQDFFKKELEKAGKGIGAMTPKEKSAFFNKIDSKYKGKKESAKDNSKENKKNALTGQPKTPVEMNPNVDYKF